MGSCWEAVKEVGERFRKDGNRTGERGVEVVADLSSSTEGDHSRARRGVDGMGCVGECKRTRGRGRGAEWEATDRRLLLSHPLWLAGLSVRVSTATSR